MQLQKSFSEGIGPASLYLVPTPIGNLEDMSFRAVRILKEADVIAAEDTRNTKKLCNYFEIETPIISYHEHNKRNSGKHVMDRLENGQTVALVSDAGMPTISDPGYELVREALEHDIPIIPLPGANAALTALIASGIDPQPFYFYGFLDRNPKQKKKELEKLKNMTATFILYESPHRLKETLQLMLTYFGNRKIVLCRELTKKFEEFIRGNLEEVLGWSKETDIRGEFCIIVEGADETALPAEETWWESLTINEHVNEYMKVKGMNSKEAIKQTAKDRNMPKRDVYKEYHISDPS
ncbi:MAG: 16S rRNA (cytidine(1402)-2'-O)-methyltransferase [Bacillus sp. (in: firmicutes)]